MGTVGTFALLVFAAFVGIGVGELLGDVLLGAILLVLIVGFTCVIYHLDKPKNNVPLPSHIKISGALAPDIFYEKAVRDCCPLRLIRERRWQ